MKRFAIAFSNRFEEGKITLEIVSAETWQEALGKHSKLENIFRLYSSLDLAKEFAFDHFNELGDIQLIEIPES